jgi:hypothetical protein
MKLLIHIENPSCDPLTLKLLFIENRGIASVFAIERVNAFYFMIEYWKTLVNLDTFDLYLHSFFTLLLSAFELENSFIGYRQRQYLVATDEY